MPAKNQKQQPVKRSKEFIAAVGRRKTATARVRLFQRDGDLAVNGMAIGKYFPGEFSTKRYLLPLQVTNTLGKVSFSAKVEGSGKSAQLDAVVHGVSRALAKLDTETFRTLLKKQGLLTRDSRKKEARKVGTGGKARRKKQSPKR